MLADGVGYMVMLGLGETWFPAFSLALGHGAVRAGLVATLPLLAGALLQLAAPAGFARARSARLWVPLCAGAQAVILAALALGAAFDRVSIELLWSLAALYYAFGMAGHPAWVGWAEQIVPLPLRARYFAARQVAIQVALFGAVCVGGWVLEASGARGLGSSAVLWPFACLFAVAALARVGSTLCLRAQTEPRPPVAPLGWSARSTIARWREGPRLRWWLALFAMQLSLQVALPFTHPWLLSERELSYAHYMALLALAFAAKAAAAWPIGAWSARHGAESALRVAAWALLPSGFAWIVLALLAEPGFPALALTQVLTGAGQGAREFAFFLLFFEGLRAEERPILLALYGLGNALAVAAGSLIGRQVLVCAGGGWTALFVCSAALRCLPLLCRIGARSRHAPDSVLRRTL
jgi:MFS family permease